MLENKETVVCERTREKHEELNEQIQFLRMTKEIVDDLYKKITHTQTPEAAVISPPRDYCLSDTLESAPLEIREQCEEIRRIIDSIYAVLF